MRKNYILDTNICLSDANNIYGFADNHVILTGVTMQEINKKKTAGGEVGFQARECARILDELRTQGDLNTPQGVELEQNGGSIEILYSRIAEEQLLPPGYDLTDNDNKIIAYCKYVQRRDTSIPTILVTADRMMRVHAAMAGVEVENYKNSQVEITGYTGHKDVEVDEDIVNDLYKYKELPASMILSDLVYENEFITFANGNHRVLTVHQNGIIRVISDQTIFGGFAPKNKMQTYALWALNNEDIPLVILLGAAGTAKTFLSLSAGLDQTYVSQKHRDGKYQRILISRPNTQANDAAFGYLPGDLDAKMEPLLLPFTDNLFTLFSGAGKEKESREQVQMEIDDLFETGVLEACALSYIRGRSLSNAYIICDEAQNSSRTLMRDIITRVSEGSKLVLCGDPHQIDAAHLDARSNGLVFASETLKESKLTAVISFDAEHSVRSELAKEAAIKMKL